MMMERPGTRVRWYLPSRSMIHSSPCATMRTPFQIVTIVNIARTMTTISIPPICPSPLCLADLQYISLDVEDPHALAHPDFLVRHRLPHIGAEERLLEADLARPVRADLAGHQPYLADGRALGHAGARLVEAWLEDPEPEGDEDDRAGDPCQDLPRKGQRGKHGEDDADKDRAHAEPDQEKARHRELEQDEHDTE